MPSPFVATISPSLAEKMKGDLEAQGFAISQPPYTLFAAKKKGVSCTLYTSGKLVIQGKEMASFIEFYLEPEILKDFSYTNPEASIDTKPRIGVDEAGKGDFFGPLCVAGVYARENEALKLHEMGVRDSKGLSDEKVLKLGEAIQKEFAHHIVQINPLKYNELQPKFGNLNHLLAWGHATTIEALSAKTGCSSAIIDQFANESVVLQALDRKGVSLEELVQRHRGEEDVVVAAASILARMSFLKGIKNLGESFKMVLPKGASAQVIAAGKRFVQAHGKENLPKIAKMHFKTLDSILS